MLVYKTDDRVGRIIFCDIHSLWIDSIRPVRIQCLLKNLLHGALFQTKFAVFGVPVKIIDPAFLAVAYAELCVRVGMRHIPAVYPVFTNSSNVEL